MKNSADQGGCYPQWPKGKVHNVLRDLSNLIGSLSLANEHYSPPTE